jgi:hypothetical protein
LILRYCCAKSESAICKEIAHIQHCEIQLLSVLPALRLSLGRKNALSVEVTHLTRTRAAHAPPSVRRGMTAGTPFPMTGPMRNLSPTEYEHSNVVFLVRTPCLYDFPCALTSTCGPSNDKVFPGESMTAAAYHLRQGTRCGSRMRNASDDTHSIHLHRHCSGRIEKSPEEFVRDLLGGRGSVGIAIRYRW